ncbi:MAG TPA: hypothetical protein VJL34_12310, partial [Anaerolineales bacterium]|nr:hypothetical protein [Anaerolineales bacterium]
IAPNCRFRVSRCAPFLLLRREKKGLGVDEGELSLIARGPATADTSLPPGDHMFSPFSSIFEFFVIQSPLPVNPFIPSIATCLLP